MKITIVRHGESIANSLGHRQGQDNEWLDTSLSEEGKEQAKKVAERLKNEDFEVIYSSDLKRAYETAEAISKYHNLEIKRDKRLREFLDDEDMKKFINNCKNFLEEIEKEGKNTLIVSHGGTSLTLVCLTTESEKKGQEIADKYHEKYKNTGVSKINKKEDKFEIEYIACDKHL